ncbi:MAG: hypothetical protein NZ869_02920 [Thermoanaerobaculum sp.]|nr:hypothetical protein [Thermoanaerobaculum sp.]
MNGPVAPWGLTLALGGYLPQLVHQFLGYEVLSRAVDQWNISEPWWMLLVYLWLATCPRSGLLLRFDPFCPGGGPGQAPPLRVAGSARSDPVDPLPPHAIGVSTTPGWGRRWVPLAFLGPGRYPWWRLGPWPNTPSSPSFPPGLFPRSSGWRRSCWGSALLPPGVGTGGRGRAPGGLPGGAGGPGFVAVPRFGAHQV